MAITISISDLRSNIATYLEKASRGANVIVRDTKKGINIAQITGTATFNKIEYEKELRRAAGILGNNHTEWTNKTAITKWLTEIRKQNDRKI